jgi:hypothetical protein
MGGLTAVTFDRGEATTTVLWQQASFDTTVHVRALAATAHTIDALGVEGELQAVNGIYKVPLAGAKCGSADCYIGGKPVLLIESATGRQTALIQPAPLPTATPTATSTSQPAPTASPTASPTMTSPPTAAPTVVPSATPSRSVDFPAVRVSPARETSAQTPMPVNAVTAAGAAVKSPDVMAGFWPWPAATIMAALPLLGLILLAVRRKRP